MAQLLFDGLKVVNGIVLLVFRAQLGVKPILCDEAVTGVVHLFVSAQLGLKPILCN